MQGASDAGLIPMVYPDYQLRGGRRPCGEKFEAAWGVPLDPSPGLTVVEIMHGAPRRRRQGHVHHGREPLPVRSRTSTRSARRCRNLDFLVVQDIFLTETAEFADVILPATSYFEKDGTYTNTDRRVQLGRQALDAAGRGAR